MRRHILALVAGFTLALSLAATPASAQNSHPRRGFWLNLGLGAGWLGCDDCSGRESGFSPGGSLGGSISQKVILGVGATSWTKSVDGTTLRTGTLDARIRFYPSATGGFFLTGGFGLGTISASLAGFGSKDDLGAGVLIGLGYDIRIGRNLSLTPYWNGFAVRSPDADTNVAQLGLGITVH
jgi:hypothetical protein